MAVSSKDIETLWKRYSSEAVKRGVSVTQFFESNGVPYHVFEKWYKKKFTQPAVVNCVVKDTQDVALQPSKDNLAEETDTMWCGSHPYREDGGMHCLCIYLYSMCNILIIKCLCDAFMHGKSRVKASLLLYLGMQNRVVLQGLLKALKSHNVLVVRMLNNIFEFGFAIKSMYLCIAKAPYYGRFEARYSTYGYADQIRDAIGSRGIVRVW